MLNTYELVLFSYGSFAGGSIDELSLYPVLCADYCKGYCPV